jgi:hypothetical protein
LQHSTVVPRDQIEPLDERFGAHRRRVRRPDTKIASKTAAIKNETIWPVQQLLERQWRSNKRTTTTGEPNGQI